MKDTLIIQTLDALHQCLDNRHPSAEEVDRLILEIGKEIDRAKVGGLSTLILDRLHEEALFLKSEILSL